MQRNVLTHVGRLNFYFIFFSVNTHFSRSLLLSMSQQVFLLHLQVCLWLIILGKLQQLGSILPIQVLDAPFNDNKYVVLLVENDPLPLEPNEGEQIYKSSKFKFWLYVFSRGEFDRPFLRVLIIFLIFLLLHYCRGKSHLFPLGIYSLIILPCWKRETKEHSGYSIRTREIPRILECLLT